MDNVKAFDLDVLDYGISTIDFIRQALSGYTGGVAIARELIQNADDARATTISFHFQHDALVVRNCSTFREQDFINIYRIASGGKRDEAMTTGTWGTGFVSVYHITDRPEVESAGRHITFNPNESKPLRRPSALTQGTVFRLPWRRACTEDGARMNAGVWTDVDIQRLRDEVGASIYALSLFLRHVRVIEVYDGDEAIPWRRVEQCQTGDCSRGRGEQAYRRETWEITFKQRGQQPVLDEWLYFRRDVEKIANLAGIKDCTVTIACPMKEREWLTKNLPYHLYNFLPTEIDTEYPFHLNGPFFPDNNRKGIIIDDDTNRSQSAWNRHVIDGLAHLYTIALLDLREATSPRRFFDLLPFVAPSKHPFLRPIHDRFVDVAPAMPIALTTLGDWRQPCEVLFPVHAALRELAAPYLPLISPEAPARAQKGLRESLGGKTMTWRHVVSYLKDRVDEGVALDDAHPMINTRQRLELLYGALQAAVGNSAFSTEDARLLAEANLCLDSQGRLRPFDRNTPRANDEARRLLAFWPFVDAEMQSQHSRLCDALLLECTGAMAVELLSRLERPAAPIPRGEWPDFITGSEHLAAILRYIARDLDSLDCEDLSTLRGLPLVRRDDDALCTGRDDVFLCDDADETERCTLSDIGLSFVHREWTNDRDISRVYEAAGVEALLPARVLDSVRSAPLSADKLAHGTLVGRLVALYGYFARHQRQLTAEDRAALLRLPLYLTQNGQLVPAESASGRIFLPGVERDDPVLAHLGTLGLNYLVHKDLVGHPFLTGVVGIRTLDVVDLIHHVILRHYNQFDEEARLDVLAYIRGQVQQLSATSQGQLWPVLRDAALIRCADGAYRRGREVYFASPALDATFNGDYNRLHECYEVPVAGPEDRDIAPYHHSLWYWLFLNVGVKEHATAHDLVAAVERIVASPHPTDETIRAVRPIYEELARQIGANPTLKSDVTLDRLRQLRWLPASNDASRWFAPLEIYQAQYQRYVGNQAPVLRFTENKDLREALRMPTEPPASVVADHLLAVARERRDVQADVFAPLYTYLGQRWDQLDVLRVSQLRDTAIIWGENGKQWFPRHVFLGDHDKYRRMFQARRCYITNPGEAARTFLISLGARERPDPWDDHVSLLVEIAREYGTGKPLNQDDLNLVFANLDHLGQAWADDAKHRLASLENLALVPGRDATLYPPDGIVWTDNADIRRQFAADAFPEVDTNQLTQNVRISLMRLGVPPLSAIVKRRPVDIRNTQPDDRLAERLHTLSRAFQRISLRLDDKQPKDKLENLAGQIKLMKVLQCPHLIVGYTLDNGRGLRSEGERRAEAALYVRDLNTLYLTHDRFGGISAIAVAKELNNTLFPGSRESVVIEQILNKKPAEVDSYLDEHNYPPLSDGALRTDTSDAVAATEIDLSRFADTYGPCTDVDPERESDWDNQDDQSVEDDAKPGESGKSALDLPALWSLTGPPQGDPNDPVPLPANSNKPSIDTHNAAALPNVAPQANGAVAPRETPVHHATRPEQLSSPHGAPAQDGGRRNRIPVFRRKTATKSPVLSNNYHELAQRYGLDLGAIHAADNAWTSDHDRLDRGEARDSPVTEARFTIKYAGRADGCLFLHDRALQMLDDRPTRLRCVTDYPDWNFDLYVDYEQRLIYNQTELPRFFDAYNIPAGGIVYLNRRSKDMVRLFWREAGTSVENVTVLELREDGQVEETVIPSVEVPCEVATYVFRAEKRFEDTDALFAEAIGKHGVFQTICNVFGASGPELDYDDIFNGVMKQRKVAQATIMRELSSRPCFVPLDNGRWRFEPSRGTGPSGDHTPSKIVGAPRLPVPSREPSRPRAAAPSLDTAIEPVAPAADLSRDHAAEVSNPYAVLLARWQQEWVSLGRVLQVTDHDPRQTLTIFMDRLTAWATQSGNDLGVLDQPVKAQESPITVLWQRLLEEPESRANHADLQRGLVACLCNGDTDQVLTQVRIALVPTPLSLRENHLYPLLSAVAHECLNKDQDQAAHAILTLLREQGAGDFDRQIAELEAIRDAREYLDLAASYADTRQQWECVETGWRQHEGLPFLRRALQKHVAVSANTIKTGIREHLAVGALDAAFALYADWLAHLNRLHTVWAGTVHEDEVWHVGRWFLAELFKKAIATPKVADINRCILRVVNTLPLTIRQAISGDDCLKAVVTAFNDLRNTQHNHIGASVLLDYWLHAIMSARQPLSSHRAVYQALDHTSKLYEHFGWYQLAERQLRAMQDYYAHHRNELNLTRDEINQASHRRSALKEKSKAASAASWHAQIEDLLRDATFACLVDASVLREYFLSEDGNR